MEIAVPETQSTDPDEITCDVRANDHLTQSLDPCQSQITQNESTEAGGRESSDDTRIQNHSPALQNHSPAPT